jgi:hypothetical protein
VRASAIVLGLISLALFVVSLVVHVTAYVPGSGIVIDRVVGLHVGAMAVFFAMAAHAAVLRRRAAPFLRGEEEDEKWVSSLIPWWVWRVGGVLFAYMFVNGVVFMATNDGAPHEYEGKFALTSHGRLVREVTEAEFHDHERYEVRGASGHWAFFSFVPTIYFLVVYPRAHAALAAGDRPTAGVR